jgi:hypothetical protein
VNEPETLGEIGCTWLELPVLPKVTDFTEKHL